jgi:glycosyltransferase involved in cell wall biosynthesis
VVFLSEHARRDAVSEDLIEPGCTAVAGVGIDPSDVDKPSRQPDGVPPGRDLLVMIGADYLHKNRLFALELVDELRRRDWDGVLVLAGAHVAHGGSAAAEAELLAATPALAAHVIDLGPVGEREKRWLLTNGKALLCPSTYEGFGLTPLEAAAAGIPCLYAAVTSLTEVVGEAGATIEPWDARASAERALPLLEAGEPRERHLASLRGALRGCEWDSIADQLHGVYRDAIGSPYRSSVPRAWEELEREHLIVLLDRAYHELRERVDHGLPLIDRGGLLSREQQRGLMRIAARRWLRGPVLGPIGLLGGVRPDDPGPYSP